MRNFSVFTIISVPAFGAALVLPSPAFGQEAGENQLSLSGEVAILTDNTDEDLQVYNTGPVLQPSIVLEHDSGFYVEVWGNVALHQRDYYNEADLTVGFARDVSEDLNLGVSAGYYKYTGGAQVTLAADVTYKGASLKGEYYIPTNSEAEGFRVTASYTKEWERFSLTPSVTHDTGTYDNVPSITVGALRAEYAIREDLSFLVTGRIPIAKQAGDERGAQITATLSWKF